ncbi:MAG: ABC transporter substrate-binding protein [Peptidiphaga gingivicola]
MRLISRRSVLGGTAAIAVAATLAACSKGSSGSDGAGGVYFLNFKPESEQAFKDIAAAYTKKTGVNVKVVTAASGTYEQTLKSEVAKSNPPTLFNLNGPVGYGNWKDYASDLSDADFTKQLTDESMALKGDESKVVGVPLAIEGYGIIYNAAILKKYFGMEGAKATSVDEIKGFDKLKEVAEDMQAKKDQLGIKGAFASTSLASGEDWRWHTHLANYPLHYELKDAKVKDTDTLKGTYLDNYKKIFDLYLKNSTVSPSEASNKSVSDSMSEFARGQAAMVQNGNWAWEQIKGDKGNVVKPEDVHFLPIYTGVKGEEKNGIAIGTENYLALNNKASEADKKASIDFVNWLYTTKEGAKLVSEDLGFIAPFDTFASQSPSDPLGKEVVKYINNKDLDPVTWDFTVFPSEDYKKQLGSHLQQYAAGKEEWSDVAKYFTSEWKKGKEQNKDS